MKCTRCDSYLLLEAPEKLDTPWHQKWADTILGQVRESDAPLVLVDLTRARFASSAFLRFLILLHKQAADKKRIMLLAPGPEVGQILEMAGLDSMFTIRRDLDAALECWNQTAEEKPDIREHGIHSEFTGIGYFRFSGNLPTEARLRFARVPARDLLESGDRAGVRVGIGLPAQGHTGCALVLGGETVCRSSDGVEVTSSLREDHLGPGMEEPLDVLVFDRLDDLVDFGCRWPDKGVPFSDLAYDVLRLARERRTDPGFAVGFLMIHDRPDKAGMLNLCAGLLAPRESLDGLSRTLPRGFESQTGVVACGVSVEVSATAPFGFGGNEVFDQAIRVLKSASLDGIRPLSPDTPVGRMAASVTCFSGFHE